MAGVGWRISEANKAETKREAKARALKAQIDAKAKRRKEAKGRKAVVHTVASKARDSFRVRTLGGFGEAGADRINLAGLAFK